MTGLTHATGVNLVANERWNFGGSTELGTLSDSQSGAQTDRKAAGFRMGYGVKWRIFQQILWRWYYLQHFMTLETIYTSMKPT